VSIVQNCCLPTFAVIVEDSYLNFLVRFITIFMPCFCLSSLPEIRSKLLLYKKNFDYAIVRSRKSLSHSEFTSNYIVFNKHKTYFRNLFQRVSVTKESRKFNRYHLIVLCCMFVYEVDYLLSLWII